MTALPAYADAGSDEATGETVERISLEGDALAARRLSIPDKLQLQDEVGRHRARWGDAPGDQFDPGSRERMLAQIGEFVASIEPGGIAGFGDIDFIQIDDTTFAAGYGSEIAKVVVERSLDSRTGVVASERLSVEGEETERQDKTAGIPRSVGFTSTIRVGSGAKTVSSDNGTLTARWQKDRVVDVDPNADYYVYLRRGKGVPADAWGNSRHVEDIDVISNVTGASAWKVIDEDYNEDFFLLTGGGCQTLSIGAYGISFSRKVCDKVYKKGDRFGGMHLEYHDTWAANYDQTVEVAFLVEVKVKQGTVPYWYDYTDAYMCSQWGFCSEPSYAG